MLFVPTVVLAQEPAFASPWVSAQSTRARLVAGGVPGTAGEAPRLAVGVEIEIDPGWKTYWRNPGTSGVPPRFDFSGSDNLAWGTPFYPAPQRFRERDGDTIGYKTSVIFPLEIRPYSNTKPVALKLAIEYGVCKDVCVPVQPELTLKLPLDAASKPAGDKLIAALARVPRVETVRLAGDPKLDRVTIDHASSKPNIAIEALYPGGAKDIDLFLEAPDGNWMPLPKLVDIKDGRARFTVDLTDGVDIKALLGRSIRATLVGSAGQTETSFKFE